MSYFATPREEGTDPMGREGGREGKKEGEKENVRSNGIVIPFPPSLSPGQAANRPMLALRGVMGAAAVISSFAALTVRREGGREGESEGGREGGREIW